MPKKPTVDRSQSIRERLAVFFIPILKRGTKNAKTESTGAEIAAPVLRCFTNARQSGNVICDNYFRAAFAFSASTAKAAGSEIASSESILRLISMPATFRPLMSLE